MICIYRYILLNYSKYLISYIKIIKKILLILLFQLSFSSLFAEILVFKNCSNKDYSFEKNEYKLDVEKGVMTRDFI